MRRYKKFPVNNSYKSKLYKGLRITVVFMKTFSSNCKPLDKHIDDRLADYKDIKKEYKTADKLIKSSKYLGRAGKAFGWAGVGYGFYSDIKHEGKTAGEAVAHS